MSETEQAGTLPVPGFQQVRHAGLLKIVLMIATLMQALDMTIANVAMPHMQAALGANRDGISWVLTSYIVASAIALPLTGWLSDRFGRRRLYLWSVGGFILSSILCGVAANLEEMVLFRLLQGLSGASLSPLAQTVLLDITRPEKRGQAMSFFGVGVMIGPVLGPILGGWLTESMNWRWVFFVNLPIGILAFAGLWFLLPDVRRPPRRLDLFGFSLLALALAAFQLMLDRGQHVDWFSSAEIWIEMTIALSAIWIFGVHVMTAQNPLYPRELLRNRNLIIAVMMMLVVGMILSASMALMPIMLEDLFGYPVLDAGYLLSSRGVGMMITMSAAGGILAKRDPRVLIAAGLAIVAGTFWEMTFWNLDVSWSSMARNGVLQGMGMGLLFVPISTMAFATLPPAVRTDASSILNLARSLGSSASISVVIAVLARNTAISHSGLAAHLSPARLGVDPFNFGYAADLVEGGLSVLNSEVMRQATMIAFLDDYYLMMLVTLCALPLSLLVRRPAGKQRPSEPIVID